AQGQTLANDRACAEEADAGDDLRGDPRRVGANDLVAALEKARETVRGHDCEQRRADTHEDVSAQACLALTELALEADRAAEPGSNGEPREIVGPRQVRQDAKQAPTPARRVARG